MTDDDNNNNSMRASAPTAKMKEKIRTLHILSEFGETTHIHSYIEPCVYIYYTYKVSTHFMYEITREWWTTNNERRRKKTEKNIKKKR